MFLYSKLDQKQNRAFPERSNPKLPSGGFYRNEMARWETDLRSPPGGQRIFLHKAKIKALFGRDTEIKVYLAETVDGSFFRKGCLLYSCKAFFQAHQYKYSNYVYFLPSLLFLFSIVHI